MQIVNPCKPWKIANALPYFAGTAILLVIHSKVPGRASTSHYRPNKFFVEDQFNLSSQSLAFVHSNQ
jgi:hypothetical protein